MAVTEPLPRERTPRRWPRRLALAVLAVVLLLALFAVVFGAWSVRRAFPQTSGEVELRGLDGPVEVHRDSLGVPTIVATTSRDLARSLGFVHAQDRFWQMDSWRHIGRGRTAELFGGAQLDTDRFLRTLGWERLARAELELLDDETVQILTDYADGVNAYLEGRGTRAIGFEYTVLGLTMPAHRPPPWEPIDSLVFLKLMAWDLRGNLEDEIERGVLAQSLTDDQLADLYPSYENAPVIVPDYGTAGDPHGSARAPALVTLLEDVHDAVAAVPSLSPPGADGIGSNSWVIGGSHTDTGSPILANDPHLGIQMPSIWYQVSLRCAARTEACVDDVAGFTFAGVPGVVIGHNGDIAWGFTNLGQDAIDLFVERVNPDDPHQYEVNGEWVDMEVETETLAVAGGEPEALEIRRTRNGPIISDVFGALDDLDPAAFDDESDGERYAIAIRWTALEPRRTIEALAPLNRARDWDEFRAALEPFAAPGQNLVYADAEGSIGYQATGVVPVRAGGDGRMPVPGWVDDYQWTGAVPYEEMPSLRDPDDDLIVAANNPVVGDDYPYLVSTDWDYGQRAARIEDLLADAERPITLDAVEQQQIDNHQHAADWLVPALLEADAAAAGDEDDVRRAEAAQELLGDWDRQMEADAAGAAVFAATWRHLLAGMFHERLPERFHPAGGARWFEVVRRLHEQPDADWWDMPGTARTETRNEALVSAAAAGVAELEDRQGDDPVDWAWGELHTATFRHQTLGESGIGVVEARFNRGPYPVAGSTSIVNAVGWHAARGYDVTWLPSMRMVVDLADVDRSRGIHTTGQSGHPYHRHYTSMIDPWTAGEQHALRWDLSAIVADAEDMLRLVP